MHTLLRATISFAVFVATFYFIYWTPLSLVHLHGQYWITFVVSLLCAVAAARFVFMRLGSQGRATTLSQLQCAMVGALTVGAVGFVPGFFGPIIFSPDSNQGPLLGLCFTGPLGLFMGGIAGVIYWRVRGDRKSRP